MVFFERFWRQWRQFPTKLIIHFSHNSIGPYPSFPAHSEAGYQPLDVGVGCSTGEPGGDPRWNAILAKGLYSNPLNNLTVWPKQPTVAVSQAAYPDKSKVCFKKIKIRRAGDDSIPAIEAAIVDFCPAAGCNWSRDERANNVDLYGEHTWKALGGQDGGGKLAVEIVWPAGIGPAFADDPDPSGLSLGGKGEPLSPWVIACISISSAAFAGVIGWAIWWHVQRRKQLARFEEQKKAWANGRSTATA